MKSTDIIRPFPARVPPLPGESLTSLIRRTAEAMGYESMARVLSLLAERGRLPCHLNQLLRGRVFNYLAALLRQPPDTVCSLTVHRLSHRFPRLADASGQAESPHRRGLGPGQFHQPGRETIQTLDGADQPTPRRVVPVLAGLPRRSDRSRHLNSTPHSISSPESGTSAKAPS